MDIPIRSVLVAVAVLCVAAAAPKANAVNPPPDGGYPGGNTAEGLGALFSLTTGSYNTAVGFFSLRTNTAGDFNTALGAATLFANTANQNTALGAGALLSNATGAFNTANGAFALFSNTDGPSNTAVGNMALFNNTSGDGNTAVGESAMIANTMGASNTAAGVSALRNNLTGNFNTAIGHGALVANQASANTAVGFRAAYGNTTGYSNTAIGNGALIANETGWENIAIGDGALASNAASTTSTAVGVRALGGGTQGVLNTAIGYEAGYNVDGIGNVCIGPGVHGEAGTLGNIWIANVYSSAAGDRAVYVNSDNKLGTLVSSRRYKDNIKLMAEASEAIFSLHPVSFRYKKEIDPAQCLSFGLIAEDVVQVDPNLVTADRNGNPETVRYEAVNAMLLNEFLKEHRKVRKLETALEALNARLKEQEMELQRVSARVEMRKAARRVASRK